MVDFKSEKIRNLAGRHNRIRKFLESLDERLLDMATGPDGLLTVEEYETWETIHSLAHLRRVRFIHDAVAGAYGEARVLYPDLDAIYQALVTNPVELGGWSR